MRVQQASNLSYIKVPSVVITNPFVTTAQVLAMAKEYGATVGEQVAVNFNERPGAAQLYLPNSLESSLRRRRIEAAEKSLTGRNVNVRVGTKEIRLEFTGILSFVDKRYVAIQVKTTRDCRHDRVVSHRRPFGVLVRRYKVAFIEAV